MILPSRKRNETECEWLPPGHLVFNWKGFIGRDRKVYGGDDGFFFFLM